MITTRPDADLPRKLGGLIESWSRSPLCNMASVFRFSSLPVHHPETVAEHTFYVSILAWVLATDLMVRGEQIHLDRVLKRAIAHDLDESLTGDIIRPFKYSSPDLHERLNEASAGVINSTYAQLPGGKAIKEAWVTAKNKSIEGRIVDFADVWSVYLYLYRESRLGNRFARNKLELIKCRVEGHDWIHPITTYAFELGVEISRLLKELS